jgi:hypothetical protein
MIDGESQAIPIELLKQRHDKDYLPGISKPDGHTLILATDGGGLAGITGQGSHEVLGQEDYLQRFDGYASLSCGNYTSALSVAGLPEIGAELYLTLAQGGIFSLRRGFTPHHTILNLNLLTETIQQTPQLNMEDIVNSRQPLFFGVTEVHGGQRMLKSTHDQDVDANNVLQWFNRGAHLPGLAGPPETDNNEHMYWDGMVSWPDSGTVAQAAGATDIIRITHGYKTGRAYIAAGEAALRAVAHLYGARPLHRGVPRHHDPSAEIPGCNPNTTVIEPHSEDELPGPFTVDAKILENGHAAGKDAMWAALRPDDTTVIDLAERRGQKSARIDGLVHAVAAVAVRAHHGIL